MDEDCNTTGLYGDHREAPYNISRENRPQLYSKMSFRESYTQNTVKEELALGMVENFRAQYIQLFPTRAPLLLAPFNECSCRKFISTFIRPTQMKFPELYDCQSLAKFIANYIKYEPLEEPEILPTRIMSPTTTMMWQVANCIEHANLLSSLLIGHGYNAFVCVGYAKRSVCFNDQTTTPWPDHLPQEVNPDDIADDVVVPKSHYMNHLKKRPKLVSQFDINERENERRRNEDAMRLGSVDEEAYSDDDGGSGTRFVHAWVLVLPDKRQAEVQKQTITQKLRLDTGATFKGTLATTIYHKSQLNTKPDGERKFITEAFFVEPSTGRTITVGESDSYYRGVESIYNHQNYYVSMNPTDKVSEIKTDLGDLMSWERIFLVDPWNGRSDDADSPVGKSNNNTLSGVGGLDMDSTRGASANDRRRIIAESSVDVGSGGDQTLELPASWVSPITLSLAQYENRFPGKQKTIHYADATVEMFADYSEPDMRVLIVSLPDDVSHYDQTHIFYKHRADKLRRRSIYPQERSKQPRKIHDWFEPGRMHDASHRVEGLRELILEPGVHRTMRFFHASRDDGLALRREKFFNETILAPRKIQEFFKGRASDDFLLYRSATFDHPRDAHQGGAHNYSGAAAHNKDMRVDPVKMTEKFARNRSIEADMDTQKRTYIRPGNNADGEIWVRFHCKDHYVTNASRMYPKTLDKDKDAVNIGGMSGGGAAGGADGQTRADDVKPTVVLSPGMEPPKDSDLLNELRVLVEKEAECLAELRAKADEAKDILAQLDRDQKDNKLTLSVYDTLRGRPNETEAEIALRKAEEKRRADSRKDYLAPFIAKQENMAKVCKGDYASVKLTADMARKVRDEAIADLKERLIERGHIMQARLDREREDLMKRQTAFQKNLDSTDGSKDADDFARFSKQSTWRIRILEERLSSYIKSSAEKYRQLADKLANDPRLAALYVSSGPSAGGFGARSNVGGMGGGGAHFAD